MTPLQRFHYGKVMAMMFGSDNEEAAVKLYPPHGSLHADQRFQISVSLHESPHVPIDLLKITYSAQYSLWEERVWQKCTEMR